MKLLNNTRGREDWHNAASALITTLEGLWDKCWLSWKKLLKTKQSILKSICILTITWKSHYSSKKKSGSEVCKTTQTHVLLCFSGAAYTLWVSDGGRVRSPSGTGRTGSGSRRLDPPQATTPPWENRSIRETEEKKRERRKKKKANEGISVSRSVLCGEWKRNNESSRSPRGLESYYLHSQRSHHLHNKPRRTPY